MNTDILDVISPETIGEDKIDISINQDAFPLLVGEVITLLFGYSRTSPKGLVKPLKLTVQPGFGSGSGYFEVLFEDFIPDSYAFRVQGAGEYLATLREVGHNQWQGRLLFTVEGDAFQEIRTGR